MAQKEQGIHLQLSAGIDVEQWAWRHSHQARHTLIYNTNSNGGSLPFLHPMQVALIRACTVLCFDSGHEYISRRFGIQENLIFFLGRTKSSFFVRWQRFRTQVAQTFLWCENYWQCGAHQLQWSIELRFIVTEDINLSRNNQNTELNVPIVELEVGWN